MTRTLSILATAAVLLPPAARGDDAARLPDKARAVLDKAESFEVWSLDAEREKDANKESFHGWKVLGKTAVTGDARKELLDALNKGLAENATGARCFVPRHGLRAVHDGVTVDLVICFECSWVHVYIDKAAMPDAKLAIGKTPAPAFDKVLKDAGVKLADK